MQPVRRLVAVQLMDTAGCIHALWLVPSTVIHSLAVDLWKSLEIEGLEGHRYLNPTKCIAPKAVLALKHLIYHSLPGANPLTGVLLFPLRFPLVAAVLCRPAIGYW